MLLAEAMTCAFPDVCSAVRHVDFVNITLYLADSVQMCGFKCYVWVPLVNTPRPFLKFEKKNKHFSIFMQIFNFSLMWEHMGQKFKTHPILLYIVIVLNYKAVKLKAVVTES